VHSRRSSSAPAIADQCPAFCESFARGMRAAIWDAMPEWRRRILSTFAVRSRPIAHGYDPLTGRPIRSEPVLACCESAAPSTIARDRQNRYV
jgi:hypothetical protein